MHIYPVTCLGFSWQKWHFFFYFKKPNTASGCTWMTLITNYRCEGRREPQIVCYKEGFCCGALSQIHAGPTPVRTLRLFFSHCCQKANSSRITRPGLGSDCKSDLPCISLSLPPAYLSPTHTHTLYSYISNHHGRTSSLLACYNDLSSGSSRTLGQYFMSCFVCAVSASHTFLSFKLSFLIKSLFQWNMQVHLKAQISFKKSNSSPHKAFL